MVSFKADERQQHRVRPAACILGAKAEQTRIYFCPRSLQRQDDYLGESSTAEHQLKEYPVLFASYDYLLRHLAKIGS